MTTMTPIPDPSQPVTGPRRRRRHLAVLLVLAGLVAAAPGVATLAGFTAQDVNRDNTISAGVLDVAFGQATSAFNVANMKPGDWFDTSVPILNTGSMTEDYSFSATSLRPGGPANLDEVLRVTVSRQGTVLAENLRFSTLRDVTGRLDAGGRDVLDLRVTWPENVPQVDNRYQGASLAMDLQVDAITTDLATTTTTPASTAPLGINGVAGTRPASTCPSTRPGPPSPWWTPPRPASPSPTPAPHRSRSGSTRPRPRRSGTGAASGSSASSTRSGAGTVTRSTSPR